MPDALRPEMRVLEGDDRPRRDRTARAVEARGVASAAVAKPRGAIVLGGDYRGLGIVRNLGRRGIPVWVVRDGHTVAAHSRFVDRVIDWSTGDHLDRSRRLRELASEVLPGQWALFPTTDQMTSVVAHDFDELRQTFVLTTPDRNTVDIGLDKRRTHALSAAAGIDVPRTWVARDLNEVKTLDLSYPVIIKPAIKERTNPLTQSKAWRMSSRAELIRQYQVACRLLPADQIMIQEMIPGDGRFQFSYAGVMKDGLPVAEVVAQRRRQYPADFGLHSTYVVSIDNVEIEQAGRRIVRDLNYTGLIEVEFKRDPRDMSLKLLDINTRVWGWHTIGVRSGVDFAYINWQLLQGEDVPYTRIPAGETWMRFVTDFITSSKEIRRGRISAARYASSLFGRHDGAIMSLGDPMPVLLDAPMLAYMRAKRALL